MLLSGLISSLARAEHQPGRSPLATEKELATFLAEVERRAFKQAVFAVRDEHLALDLVQDAMLKLTQSYGAKPATELPLLFQRILQNTIRDHYRRQKVRSLWTTLLSSLCGKQDEEEHDPLDTLLVEEGPGHVPRTQQRIGAPPAYAIDRTGAAAPSCTSTGGFSPALLGGTRRAGDCAGDGMLGRQC